MFLKRITAALCVFAILSSMLAIPVFAAEVAALDLSENRTRFEDEEVGTQGEIKVFAIDAEGERREITGDTLLSYTSSASGVCSIDRNGNYSINGKGITVVTVEYEDVSRSMIVNCGGETYESINHDTYTDYNTGKVQNITLDTDEFRGKNDVLYCAKPLNFSMKNHAGKNTYIASTWLYDSMDMNKDVFKFGARTTTQAARLIYGAYVSSRTYCSSFGSPGTMTKLLDVRKDREKGWHQFFEIVTYENDVTHIMMFYDGEKVSEYTLENMEISPYFVDMSENFFQELYLSEFSVAAFAFTKSNMGNDNVLENPEDAIEIQFSKNIDEHSFIAESVSLKDDCQKIEVKTEIDGNKLIVKPKYPLSYNRDYSLTIDGNLMSVADYFSPQSRLGSDLTLNFKTGQRGYYAENHIAGLEKTVNASAELAGSSADKKGYILAVQFDKNGTMQKINAAELPDAIVGAEKNEQTEALESYVLSDIAGDTPEILSKVCAGATCERKQIEPAEDTGESFANVVYDPDNGYVEIKGVSAAKRKGLPVLVRIVKPEKDYRNVSCKDINEVYDRIEVVETDASGKFNYSFMLGGAPGTYNVLINLPFEEQVLQKEMRYASKDAVYEAMKKIYQASEDELITKFNSARDVLDLYYEKYEDSKYPLLILKLLQSYGEKQTFKAFEAAYSEAAALVNALEAEAEETARQIESNKVKWQLDGISTTEIYQKLSGAVQKEIAQAVLETGFDNVSEFAKIFSEYTAMNSLRKIKNSGEIYSLLSQMNDVFKIDFSMYNKLSAPNKDKATDSFAEKLPGIKSADKVREEFEAVVKKVSQTSTQQSGGGNTSGGLRGGSGGGLTSIINGSFEANPESSSRLETPEWVQEENARKQRKVFTDLEGVTWAEESIRELYNLGVIAGKAEGLFMPNDCVTREELVKMLVIAMGIESSEAAENKFSDVDISAWYAPYVNTAYAKGIVQGKGENVLGIGEYITREEICTIADRAAEAGGIFLDEDFTIQSFLDEDEISVWALQSVLKMRESFIVSGVGGNYFKPKELVTRAQAAKIIYGIIAFSAV